MRHINVIGIGCGNPHQLTLEAIAAMQESRALFAIDKANAPELLNARREIVEHHAPDVPLMAIAEVERDRNPANYEQEVNRWHDERARVVGEALTTHIPDNGSGSLLVWGDPNLYDSTLRILRRVQDAGCALDLTVIPGITAVQALTAHFHLVLNRIGEPITITTGRALTAEDTNAVVMLDGGTAWQSLPGETMIYWGAYLGTDYEVTRSGTVAEIGAELADLKASLRSERGWIMDIYLVRR